MKLGLPFAIVSVALGTSACSLLFGENFDNAFARAGDAGPGAVAPGSNPTTPVAPNADGSCASDRKKCGDLCVSLLDPSFGCAAAICSPCSTGAAVCSKGVCAASCTDGQTACNGACVEATGDPNQCTAPVEQGKPGTWKTVASMPTARSDLGAVVGADGRIFAIGGYGWSSSHPVDVVEAYTPSTNSWATLPNMPTARAMLGVARGADGRIYAIGGYGDYIGATGTVEAYTPSTNTWATVASMPTARVGLVAVTGPDGRIFAIGGSAGKMLTTVEAYDPSTNSWATVASMSTARNGHAVSLGADGRVFVMGGYTQPSITTILATVEAYDPSTNSWATVASMPAGRRDLAATRGADGRIFAIGGSGYNPIDKVEAYTPSTNSWATVASMPTPRGALAAVTTPDGRIFAIGGYGESAFDAFDTVEQYTP